MPGMTVRAIQQSCAHAHDCSMHSVHDDEDAAWEMNSVAQTLLAVPSVLAVQMG